MKKAALKKSFLIFVPIVVVIILLTAFKCIGFEKVHAYFSVFSFADDFDDNNQPMSKKNYEMLSHTEQQAYISIFNNIENHPEYIKVPKLTQSEFTNVYFAVKNDNPDMLCFSDSCNMITFMSSCFLQLHYDYEKDVCKYMTAELATKVNEIMRSIDISDEYTAELEIHDYIILNCTYTEDAENASSAYGCLVNGEAVCSGYSRAAMLLLHNAGIDSILIGGTGITAEGENISHMWNVVWINNEPYHLDVTWDDSGASGGSISHLFFNLTTDAISFDHKDMSADIDCNSLEANYFVKENLIYNEYNTATLQHLMMSLCDNIDNGINYLEFEFTEAEAYNSAVNAIINNSTTISDMYKIIEYVAVNAKNKVDTTHINFVQDNAKKYIRLMFDSM